MKNRKGFIQYGYMEKRDKEIQGTPQVYLQGPELRSKFK